MDILAEKMQHRFDTPIGTFVIRRLTPRQRLAATALALKEAKAQGFSSLEELRQNQPDIAAELELSSMLNMSCVEKPDGFDFLNCDDPELFGMILSEWDQFNNSFRKEV